MPFPREKFVRKIERKMSPRQSNRVSSRISQLAWSRQRVPGCWRKGARTETKFRIQMNVAIHKATWGVQWCVSQPGTTDALLNGAKRWRRGRDINLRSVRRGVCSSRLLGSCIAQNPEILTMAVTLNNISTIWLPMDNVHISIIARIVCPMNEYIFKLDTHKIYLHRYESWC